MVNPTTTRMTTAEFYQLPETTQPTELINGECIVSPAPTPAHQTTIGRFFLLLNGMIPNGQLFFAPIDVYLDDENSVQPDLVWVAAESRCKIGDKRLEGPPDLVVEIFSPGTARRDKSAKFDLYERHGVREYWMVDPTARYLEVWRWHDGRFVRQGIYGPGESFTSAVLGGAAVDLNAIFPT